MGRKFTKYPSGYVKANERLDSDYIVSVLETNVKASAKSIPEAEELIMRLGNTYRDKYLSVSRNGGTIYLECPQELFKRGGTLKDLCYGIPWQRI